MKIKPSKQRLVGVLVLLALAVIFIPVIFDFQPSRPLDKTARIPPAPDIEPVIIELPVEPTVEHDVLPQEEIFDLEDVGLTHDPESEIDQIIAAEPEKQVTETKVVATPEIKEKTPSPATTPPKLAENGLPEAWVIQVVSYQEKFKADALTQRLTSAGYRAFVRTASIEGATYYRVYVGPHIMRSNADKEKLGIDASLGVKSLVIPFEP